MEDYNYYKREEERLNSNKTTNQKNLFSQRNLRLFIYILIAASAIILLVFLVIASFVYASPGDIIYINHIPINEIIIYNLLFGFSIFFLIILMIAIILSKEKIIKVILNIKKRKEEKQKKYSEYLKEYDEFLKKK
ncbi:MAG: hypothetical protein JXA99_13540 [Candidatus Lokiarchaeota archaeon]|nr:hypothetical protein [Candidatus Lokiarchaeota archaeon]